MESVHLETEMTTQLRQRLSLFQMLWKPYVHLDYIPRDWGWRETQLIKESS